MLSKYILNRVMGYINHYPDLKKIGCANYEIYYIFYKKFKKGCMRVSNSDTEYECIYCNYINCETCSVLNDSFWVMYLRCSNCGIIN